MPCNAPIPNLCPLTACDCGRRDGSDNYGTTKAIVEANMPNAFRERANRLRRDIGRELARLKIEDPEKYQGLIDAERRMYESYLEHSRQ